MAAMPARYALERGAWADAAALEPHPSSFPYTEALTRAAAEMEDRTEESAVTPGPLAPVRELLGQMLLQLAQPAEALKEFEATLKKEPNPFRGVRRGNCGLEGRRPRKGADLLRSTLEDLRERRQAGKARADGSARRGSPPLDLT
jgi:hypothetical protein